MNTITLFLLVVLGNTSGTASRNTEVLERFASEAECQRVAKAVTDAAERVVQRGPLGGTQQAVNPPPMLCLKAQVARP